MILAALAAATLSGSCTSIADEVGGNGGILTAALVSGGIALAISLLFVWMRPTWRGAKLLGVICVASYLAAGFGAWFLLIWPFAMAIAIAVAGGLIAHPVARLDTDIRAGYAATAVISGVGIAIAALAVVVGFWFNYDLNAGWFDGGGGPSSLNILPFALICGGVPPILGVIAVLMTGGSTVSGGDFTSDRNRPAAPTQSPPSTKTVAILLAIVVICAAIVTGLGSYFNYASHVFEASLSILFAAGVALVVGILFALLTPDRRGVWLFAVIGISAYIAGEIARDWGRFADPWEAVAALAVVVISGGVAGYIARRKFDARGGLVWIAGVISLLGIFVAAGFVADGFYGRIPFESSFVFGGAPIAIAAITAHLAGRVCRWYS